MLVDPAFAGLDAALSARAYQSLPERSRAVLWHTEVERDAPAAVALLLGLTRNGVVALRRRAMDDLRQTYLQMHIALITQPGCRPVAERLGAFDRRSLTAKDAALVSEHLARCEGCQVVHRELTDITATVRAVVAPLVLGSAADAYLADAGHHGPVVTAGRTGRASPTARTGSGSNTLSPAGMTPGNQTAPLSASELALLPGHDQIGHSHRLRRRSFRDLPRLNLRSGRVAAAVAAGAVVAAIGGITLALALTGNNNAPPSAHRLPPAPSRQAAATRPSLSPSPSPSASPSPSPPPAPVAAAIQLTASLNISTHGTSGHPDLVVFQVTNAGSGASGPLTAVIALPAGSSLSGDDSSGSGGDNGTPEGTAQPLFGGWNCQSTSGGATCTHAALSAGQQAQGMLFITVTSSAACGQPIGLTVTSGGATAGASADIHC